MVKLPTTMQALVIPIYDNKRNNLILTQKAVPRPRKANEVLIKMAAASINPSDVVFLEGRYGVKKPLPVTPGFEGSGVVVATGSGLMARALLGRRVACGAPNDGDGCWAEYMLGRAEMCLPLLPFVSLEQGATALTNPLTAWGLIELAQREGHRAVVHSGAAGAVGQMIGRLGQAFNLTIVHVVWREEQVEQLRAQGAKYVLNSQADNFEAELRALCQDLTVTLALDAVAGPMGSQLLKAMPKQSHLVVYGALSNKPCEYRHGDIIFGNKKVSGFWMTPWLFKLSPWHKLRVGWQVQRRLSTELKTHIQARFPLAAAHQGLNLYTQTMSAGKVLLTP